MSSHYVPAFCQQRGVGRYVQEKAVCGTWVSPHQHDVEPSCERCREWLILDAEDHAIISAQWEREDQNPETDAARKRERDELERKWLSHE